MCPALALVVALVAAAPAASRAQAPPPVPAVRLTAPVTVDGVLDEPVWQGPPSVARLVQRDPDEGAAARESTQVWVAYDDEALYVAARCWDTHPDSIVADLTRRDVTGSSDRFMVYLDPFHDRRNGFYFGITAAGVLLDGTLFNDGWDDDAWDAVWSGRARRVGGTGSAADTAGADPGGRPAMVGWTLEIRVPFSQLRYRRGVEQVWGIDFKRFITRYTEDDYLVYTPSKEAGYVSRFPDLVGLRNGHHSGTLEVTPYVNDKGEFFVRQPGDPFHDGSRQTAGMGADLRASVGSNMTLNATVNPDFGQVEVDPAVVNLSDVESYFQEKRPFFTDNARTFSFGNEGADDYWGFNWPEPTFFYSRRIGRAPQGALPDDTEFSDVPVATRILGAAKLTGRPVPGLSVGALSALTSREMAGLDVGGLLSRPEVEPLTYYGVARGLKEFPGGRNGLGAMTTLVQRRFDGGDGLRDQLDRQSLMAGLDGWHFLDREKAWVLSGWAAMSRVAGTTARMIALQEDPRHYLQRPDVGYLGVDSSATSLTGYGARVWLNHQKGSFLSNSAIGFMSPRFDVNDMGYQSYADVVNGHLGTGWRWTVPNAWRKNAFVLAAWYRAYDTGGDKTAEGFFGTTSFQFANNYDLRVDGSYSPRSLNARQSRGGPLMVNNPDWWSRLHFDTDSKSRLYYYVDWQGDAQPSEGSWYASAYPGVEWKPVARFSMSVGPGLEATQNQAQYVTTIADPTNTTPGFGGSRYVFARLDQRTVSANIRLNVSFTPDLSLQAFIQPLISAARYSGFKELARSRSFDFLRYGVDNGSTWDPVTGTVDPDGPGPAPPFALADPSFNFKSLRGNAVLRWEYRPGSVLYVVWTQQRTDTQDTGELDFGASARRLFDAHADDILLVKLTYYLGL